MGHPPGSALANASAIAIINGAATRAREIDTGYVNSAHMMLQLLRRDNGMIDGIKHRLTKEFDLTYDRFRNAILEYFPATGPSEDGSVEITDDLRNAIVYAVAAALAYSGTPVFGVQHVLVGVVTLAHKDPESGVGRMFGKLQLDARKVMEAAYRYSGLTLLTQEEANSRLYRYVEELGSVLNGLQDLLGDWVPARQTAAT